MNCGRPTNPLGRRRSPCRWWLQGPSVFWQLPLVLKPFPLQPECRGPAVALLVAVMFWSWLWGPVGLLLSTPRTICLGVLGKYVPQLDFIGVLISDGPVLEASTRYYQRLVARDDDEAMEIVDEFLKTHALEGVYDTVLVPALVAAKSDERTRNEFRVKVARDNGFWVQGSLRPWENPGNICAAFLGCTRRGGSPWTRSRSR